MISLLLNKYVMGGVLVAAILAGCAFAYWHHGNVRYTAGIAAQQVAEAKSLAIYTQARNAQLASAEASYHAEIDNLRLHPIDLGPVRLREYVPSAASQDPVTCGPASAAPATGPVPGVPSRGDPVRSATNPPDISGLLESYAAAADRISAQLRALIEAAK